MKPGNMQSFYDSLVDLMCVSWQYHHLYVHPNSAIIDVWTRGSAIMDMWTCGSTNMDVWTHDSATMDVWTCDTIIICWFPS